jgi:hypothetical protein
VTKVISFTRGTIVASDRDHGPRDRMGGYPEGFRVRQPYLWATLGRLI